MPLNNDGPDFTTQMLYASTKIGLTVPLWDLGLNVLVDLIEYSAKVDAEALSANSGKKSSKSPPMNISQLTKLGKVRG